MELVHIAKVAVDLAAFHFDELFSYRIPRDMISGLKRGCRVMVPFGGGKTLRQGMVFSVETEQEDSLPEGIKTIRFQVDATPVLSEELLQLSVWMRENTFCTYYDAIKAMIPSGMHMKHTQKYLWGEHADEAVRSYFSENGNHPVTAQVLSASLGVPTQRITEMVKNGELAVFEDLHRKMRDDKITMIEIVPDAESMKLTSKQQGLLSILEKEGPTSLKDACYKAGVTKSVASTLVKKGCARLFEEIRDKSPFHGEEFKRDLPELSDEQRTVYSRLLSLIEENRPAGALLQGVTGSGKTNVYMHLIKEVIRRGKTAIVLVPEISLTPQVLKNFFMYFGCKVAVLHSALSMGERMDQFRKIQNGEIDIVVGTRSAIFAPLQNIGLVVIDEEQESSYRSESTPRYHARNIARFRCGANNSLLLLCSATPSVETYYKAKKGSYELLQLKNRFFGSNQPQVVVADMREEYRDGNMTGLSRVLLEELENCFRDGKQAMILLNRRGYQNYVSCLSCGTVLKCPSCSISMTYHAANHSLMCHYCGHVEPVAKKCPSCGSDKLQFQGYGTQRLEEELISRFPRQKFVRMDADTTNKKNSHHDILAAFEKGEYDVLLGTQMIAKGLDFDNVSLVGVLNADQTLFSNDFKSFERTFSLLTQVVGRSGRRGDPGKAVIQTISPDQETIQLASRQDYEAFFSQEIQLRKAMLFPPFCSICVIHISGEKEQKVTDAALELMRLLCGEFQKDSKIPVRIMGPSPEQIYKMNNRFRMRIVLKCKNDRNFRRVMRETVGSFMKTSAGGIRVGVDMDPESV